MPEMHEPGMLAAMSYDTPEHGQETVPPDALGLIVGCEFEFEAVQPVAAVMQVAPRPEPRVRIEREQWDTGSDHHGYLDHYENRCERFTIEAGSSRIRSE